MKIEKGIPIPRRSRISKYPKITEMEVGDSILFPREAINGKVYKSVKNHERSVGKVFSARSLQEGLRIWRIA